jgi:uncharacterized repeat protein (TIGR01451 family)
LWSLKIVDSNAPDLVLKKEAHAAEPLTPGRPISFVITVDNAGCGPALDARLVDIVPSGIISLSYESSVPVTPMGGVSYAWQLGDLVGGATVVLTVSGWVDAELAVPTAIENVATATSSNEDIDPSDNEARATLYLDVPIVGLEAWNDGPTPLGKVTTLNASVEAGGHVTYEWTLGDGESALGAEVQHVYPSMGVYTATVTARNSFGSAIATTQVVIGPSRFGFYVPLIYRHRPGPGLTRARR